MEQRFSVGQKGARDAVLDLLNRQPAPAGVAQHQLGIGALGRLQKRRERLQVGHGTLNGRRRLVHLRKQRLQLLGRARQRRIGLWQRNPATARGLGLRRFEQPQPGAQKLLGPSHRALALGRQQRRNLLQPLLMTIQRHVALGKRLTKPAHRQVEQLSRLGLVVPVRGAGKLDKLPRQQHTRKLLEAARKLVDHQPIVGHTRHKPWHLSGPACQVSGIEPSLLHPAHRLRQKI